MGTVPVPHVWATGEVATASNMNLNDSTVANFLLNKPFAKVRQTSVQSLPNGGFTALQFQTADENSDSMYSSGSPTKLTAQTPGWYDFSGKFALTAATTGGRRGCVLAVNGTQQSGSQVMYAGSVQSASGVLPVFSVFLNANDYAEYQAFQDQGAAQNTDVGSGIGQAYFRGLWVHA